MICFPSESQDPDGVQAETEEKDLPSESHKNIVDNNAVSKSEPEAEEKPREENETKEETAEEEEKNESPGDKVEVKTVERQEISLANPLTDGRNVTGHLTLMYFSCRRPGLQALCQGGRRSQQGCQQSQSQGSQSNSQ